MPWRGPEYPGEFPTLGYQVADLIQAVCAVPDGDHMGEPYVLTDSQLRFLLWHYRIDPDTGKFTYFRGSQLVRPQKQGKGPFSSAVVCAEAHPEAPVRPDGWDANGDPVGRPWASPWIQITAVSEDQTDNVWRALVPMIELGQLAADIPDTGQTRINLPGGGRIEPVTASARSRLGQRVTFCVQDETHSWLERNGGLTLADNQRRNLAGMGGRFLATTNAWDPGENSAGQRLAESGAPGVYHDDIDPGPGSVRNKADRRRMLKRVYGDAWWVDLDRIDGEIVALLEEGEAAQAERFFLNRKQAAESAAFDVEQWKRLARPRHVADGATIVIGVDGARHDDAVALVATEVESGYQWPLGIWTRPKSAPDEYEHPFHEIDAALADAFEHWTVWRVYIDPQYIDHLVDAWRGRYGDKRVVEWFTNRPRQACWTVRNYTVAINTGDLSHDGDETFAEHIRNARKRRTTVRDDDMRPMHVIAKDRHDSPRKIDAAMAGALSWEARGDAIADGAQNRGEPLVAWA
jgi:hypothetical protein